MSGGGGATAAGAQGMGAGIASGHEMGIKQQGRGMGLQAAAIASQIDLNSSQAEKNRADAKKTSGVDTDLQNANIEYVIAQTENEKVKKGLIYANTRLLDAQEELQRISVDYTKQKADEVRWNIKLVEKEVERLAIKTYQSDIFNNWINTEWLDGEGGINEITAIDTSSGSFTMDTLNLAKKVYDMLNRIAVSGGTYQDWIQTVYTNDYIERSETPIYEGGFSSEIIFQEVISNSATENEPLGTLS